MARGTQRGKTMNVYFVLENGTQVTSMTIGADSAYKDSSLVPEVGSIFAFQYAPDQQYSRFEVLKLERRFTANNPFVKCFVTVKFIDYLQPEA
jgi:hypothetical protein